MRRILAFLFMWLLIVQPVYANKATVLMNNFTRGDISPLVENRTDLSFYYNAASVLENFIILPYGGITKAPGTRFVAEVKDSTKKVRLIPFQFNTEQAYILEFGDGYIRFYMNGGQIENGGSPYEISSPYEESDLFNIQYAQSADVMYLVHKDYAPRKLSRTDHTSWTLTTVSFAWGPFMPVNRDSSHTMDAAGSTGTTTITSSISYFTQSHLGAQIKLGSGYATITSVNTSSQVTVSVKESLPTSATSNWAMGAWNDVHGYPTCVTFHKQRLYFAGSKDRPQTVWGSQTTSYENFGVGSDDAFAVEYTISSNHVNAIQWLSASKILVIGTHGGVFSMTGGGDAAITPSNVEVSEETAYGCNHVIPERIGNFVYYIQRGNRKLREFAYNFERDGYIANELTLLSPDMTESGITDTAYQQSPYNIVWCIRNDGKIATLTRLIEQEVTGWSVQSTDGDYESIAIIPNNEQDQVWVSVKRNINGTDKRYIEYFDGFDIEINDMEDSFFVHSGLSYDDVPTSTVSGLDHLEGEEVVILADGEKVTGKTVSSGSVTLDTPASKIHAGLPYSAHLETLDPEAGAVLGTAQTKKKYVYYSVLRLCSSRGGSFGTLKEQYDLRYSGTGLFTGDLEIRPPSEYVSKVTMVLDHDDPYPFTLTALVLYMETNDR